MTHVLLLSGSLRARSSSSAALRVLREVAPAGTTATIFDGLRDLPPFDPDLDAEPLPATVAALRVAIAAADGIVISTPEYAGTLPGAFKNLLDWCVGGTEINDKPVVWLNTGAPWRGQGAISTLETVLGYVQTQLLRDLCVTVTVDPGAVADDGAIAEPGIVADLAQFLVRFVAALHLPA